MNEQVKEFAGLLVAVILTMDGLLHIFWATGRVWPARDPLTLIQVMLNSNKTRLLKSVTLVPIATLLFLGALIVLARIHYLGQIGQLIPAPLLQLGILVLAAGLLLRGLAGIVWALGLMTARSKLFYKLNLIAYTPVCLILCAATVVAALS